VLANLKADELNQPTSSQLLVQIKIEKRNEAPNPIKPKKPSELGFLERVFLNPVGGVNQEACCQSGNKD